MEEKTLTIIEQTQKPDNLINHCNIHEKYNRYCRDCDLTRLTKNYYEKGRDLVTCDICKSKVVKNSYKKHLETLVHIKATFTN